MLQIRLNKGSFADGVSVAKSLPVETVTVACPDHLVIADLPVAKGLGSATSASRVKIVGRRSRRQLGERVHFCVRCDFPIAVYGRLSPCEHAYCLDCARSDSICYLCDERIQKIQTIKMMEGIFVCAAPHCLKSFLKKVEFESHIHETHTDLLHPSSRKEDLNRSESFSGKLQNQASESSSVRTPTPRPAPPPCHMNPPQPPSDLLQDRARRGPQFREQTPLRPPLMQPRGGSGPSYFGQNSTNLQQLPDLAQESGIRQRPDFPGPQGHIPNFDSLSDKQQQQQHGGILSDPPSHYPPSVYYQHPNHPGMGPPPPFFSMSSPLQSDGGAPPPFYGGGGRSDSSAIEIGSTSSEPGLASSFPPGGGGSSDAPPGFDGHPPRPWSAAGPSGSGVPFESAMQAGGGQHMNNMIMEGIYQGDNTGRSSLPPLTPLAVPMMNFNKAATAEQSHQGSSPKGGGVLSSVPPPPPGPPPPHILQQQKHGNFFSGGGEGMN